MKKIIGFVLIILVIVVSVFSINYVDYRNSNIICNNSKFKELYKLSKDNNIIKSSIDNLQVQANEILKKELCEYKIDEGGRLLDVSKELKNRVEILCFCAEYLELNNIDLELANIYKDKVKENILHVCNNFPNWHPSHFLDTAEMAYGVSLGYDFLYDDLSEEERDIIEQAIIEKALIPSCKVDYLYMFSVSKTNWNQVCNSALGVAAIVVKNSDNIVLKDKINDSQILRELANENNEVPIKVFSNAIIKRSIDNLPTGMMQMYPDGAYKEGVTYWEYANTYTVYFLSALNEKCGTDYNLLSDNDYLINTILYPIYITGNSEKVFNYWDSEEDVPDLYPSIYLAQIYCKKDNNNENYLKLIKWYEQRNETIDNIYELLWYEDISENLDYSQEQLEELGLKQDKVYSGTEIAVITDGYKEQSLYLGIKAGNSEKATHEDLDVGSFVLDINGIRWIDDYGPENYNVPNYWRASSERWNYYKKRAEGHSTINVINENIDLIEDQNTTANCIFSDFSSFDNKTSISIDMSSAYFQKNSAVVRSFSVDKKNKVIVLEDDFNINKKSDIYSFLNISNGIDIQLENDKRVLLKKENQTIVIELESEDASIIKIPKKSIREEINEYNSCNIEDAENYKLVVYYPNVISGNIKLKISVGE